MAICPICRDLELLQLLELQMAQTLLRHSKLALWNVEERTILRRSNSRRGQLAAIDSELTV